MTQTEPPVGESRPKSSAGRSTLIIIGIAIVVILGAAAVFLGLSLRGTAINATQEVAAGTRVSVNLRNAEINLRPSTDGRVHVTAEGSYLGEEPVVTAKTSGEVTSIAGRGCENHWFGRCELQVTVALPEALRVTVLGSNGAVTATGLIGPLDLETTNGRIDVNGASRRLELKSTNGAIRLREATSPRVSATTSNGSVDLDFARAPVSVEATSSNGAVTVRVPVRGVTYFVDVRTTNGAITTNSVPSDRAAGRTITVRTSNGAVTVAAN